MFDFFVGPVLKRKSNYVFENSNILLSTGINHKSSDKNFEVTPCSNRFVVTFAILFLVEIQAVTESVTSHSLLVIIDICDLPRC